MARSQPDGRDPNQTWEIPTSKSGTLGSDGRDHNRCRCSHATRRQLHTTRHQRQGKYFTIHPTRHQRQGRYVTIHPTHHQGQVRYVSLHYTPHTIRTPGMSCFMPPGPGQVCHVIGILTMVFLMVSVSRREYIYKYYHVNRGTYVYRLLPLPPSLHLGSVDFFGFV